MKRSASILAVLLLTTMLFAAGTQESASNGDKSLKYIMEKGEIIIGLNDSFPPMGFRDTNGEIAGFDIDLAKEVCKRLGVELKLQPIDWDAKILDLNNRNIDIIWNRLSISDERKEKIEFSKPYIANKQIIIVQPGSGISMKSDLAAKKIGIQLGSTAEDAVKSYTPVMESFTELVKYQDNVQALMDLEVGRIDAVVVDEIFGRYYLSGKPGIYKIAEDFFAAEEYAIGFRKDELAFIHAVDHVIDEMAADGTAAEISKKWFAEDILLAR
ncbi:MAG: amino acid ABC transporter substrate-binding protein [Spirochaetales bacterium]|nr:amino acid ABC transporter substrate-binding protein [Spirochaetales bacterium]